MCPSLINAWARKFRYTESNISPGRPATAKPVRTGPASGQQPSIESRQARIATAGGRSPERLELALLADLGGLTNAVTQVVELRTADIATGDELDLLHDW